MSAGFMWARKLNLKDRATTVWYRLLTVAWPRELEYVPQRCSTDCGAAALATVLRYHGHRVSSSDLLRHFKETRSGATARELLTAARSYGVECQAYSLAASAVRQLPKPAILHWQRKHFVVLRAAGRRWVDIVDPARGPVRLRFEAFAAAFSNVAVVFETRSASAQRSGWARLIREVFNHKQTLCYVIGASIILHGLGMALPLITGVLIDRVVPAKDHTLLLALAVGFCAAQAGTVAMTFVRTTLLTQFRMMLETELTSGFVHHLSRLPLRVLRDRSTGSIITTLGSNGTIHDTVTSVALSTVVDGIGASVFFVLLFRMNWELTLLVVVLTLTRIAVMRSARRRHRDLLQVGHVNRSRYHTAQIEMLDAFETIKGMGLESQLALRWLAHLQESQRLAKRGALVDAGVTAVNGMMSLVTTLLLTFGGAYAVLNDRWSLGSMMAFAALVAGFNAPLIALVSTGLKLQTLQLHLDRVADIMDIPAEPAPPKASGDNELAGGLAAIGMSFRYAEHLPSAICNVSFTIPAGAFVAIVGKTGSGKSSLARMMAALYEPADGQMLFDGRSADALNRIALRRQIGLVTQEPPLFGWSIRDNIALAVPGESLEGVVKAARLACIHDDIEAMPDGYGSVLADRGRSLSGGQRQRLAIARALVVRPAILILDEATSHLDASTERAVLDNIASLHCTKIAISHRVETVRRADLVLILERGCVKAFGPPGQSDVSAILQEGGWDASFAVSPNPRVNEATCV